MTFLNAILAFGTLAFTVPLVIHLLNRSRYRTIEWGAMIFLEEQKPSNSRKIEWKHLLLLLVRCMIPICLALAMARPYLSGSSLLGVREPIATVVVLDDSLSMQSKSSDGQTRWSGALRSVDEVLKSLPEGSESHLVLAGQSPKSISQDDIKEQIQLWSVSPSVTGSVDLVEATKKSLEWLSNQSLTRRQLIYISDFQSTDWSNDMDAIDEVKRLASEQIIPPVMSWLNVAEIAASETDKSSESGFRNYSLSEPVITPTWFTEKQVVTLFCNVHNHSLTTIDSLVVTIQLDDKTIDSQKINIAPSSSTRLTTRFVAPNQGWHLLKIKIEAIDDLEIDNTKQIPFIVQSRSQILLVDGDLRSEPMQSQSDFLRIALSPFTFSQVAGADYFDTRVVSVDKFRDTNLDDVTAIALCNVPRVDPAIGTKMREFMERGGGVIAFLGNRVDLESWNRLPTLEQGGVRFFVLSPSSNSQSGNTADNPMAIALESLEASLFRELSQASRESIASVVINRSSSIALLEDSKSDRIASFTNDEPWVIRQGIGKGAMWVMATSCDAADTNMPTRPVFVPLMQRLFHAVSNSKPSLEAQESGTPWFIRSAAETDKSSAKSEMIIKVMPPRLAGEEIRDLTWTETRQIGLYEANWEQDSQTQKAYCWMEPYSTSPMDNHESARFDMARDEILKLAEVLNVKYFDTIEELQASDQSRWKGREVGNWFWFGALICFIAEMLIAQSFSVHRRIPIKSSESKQSTFAARGLG